MLICSRFVQDLFNNYQTQKQTKTMTQVLVNDSIFQVQPFVRYKENRLKGEFISEIVETGSEPVSTIDMAIVKINQISMNIGGIARIPLVEVWGFVVGINEKQPQYSNLSTFISLRFDLETTNYDKIYHLHFLLFHTDTRQVYKLHSTGLNPQNNFEKFALEVAQDIRESAINFCCDPNIKNVTI